MATNPLGRNSLRDVFFADLRNPGVDLGGLIATRGMTHVVFHIVVQIALDVHEFSIRKTDGELLQRDQDQLLPGRYLVLSDEPVLPSTKRYFTRALSESTGTRLQSFKDEVRARDGRCVISKVASLGPLIQMWSGFQTAHIVPLAYMSEWNSRGFSSLITIPPPPPRQEDKINSVQNGLLMQSTIHELFDSYNFSILPEEDYKIVFFVPDMHGLDGTHLDRELLDDERRPPDELLLWHFEQAVLCNVRGAGEPHFDFDFPPGSDMMGEILAAPKAAERMEFELFTRLGASHILTE